MKSIEYKEYFDKVFGCWLGKSISGTIGAPFEGRKEVFNYSFDKRSIEQMLPNDDLDLQILWLEVLEKKGIHFTTEDLADSFLNNCPYAPGEYAVFKKNYARGIRPPLSGTFNNSYYLNGMGCPIRSEIWACISPGNSRLASEFSWKDGIMDHGEDSVWAEVFLATMEAEAFFEKDMRKLISTGYSCLPRENKVAKLILDIIAWFDENNGDWKRVRNLIISKYGHPDCTNLYQNMGIIILALLAGSGDFLQTTMTALNCGFDTDCTCATTGAVLGIIYGADFLMREYGFTDVGYVLGVKAERRSNSLYDLAVDTCRIGAAVTQEMNELVRIQGCPDFEPVNILRQSKIIDFSVQYPEGPSIGIGESKRVTLAVKNLSQSEVNGELTISLPNGWENDLNVGRYIIASGEGVEIDLKISVPEEIELLHEKNILEASFKCDTGTEYKYSFGINGAAVWKMYGPFWSYNVSFPEMNYWEPYGKYITGSDENDIADKLRRYHLNNTVDIERAYMNEPNLTPLDLPYEPACFVEQGIMNIHEDRFSINDFVCMEGPCVVYLERFLYSPEEREAAVLIGHTDPYKLWINGLPVSESHESDWCTNENKHILNFKIDKGITRLVLKLARQGAKADYSLIFTENGLCMDHLINFSSLNPNSSGHVTLER